VGQRQAKRVGNWIIHTPIRHKGVYYGRARHRITGMVVKRSLYTRSKGKVDEALMRWVTQLDEEEMRRIDPLLFAAGIDEFLKLKTVRPTSMENYKARAKVLKAKWGTRYVHDILPKEIEEFFRDRAAAGRKQSTLRLDCLVLKMFLRWCVANHHCNEDPCSGFKPPRGARARKGIALSLDEARQLLQLAGEPYEVERPAGSKKGGTTQVRPALTKARLAILIALHTGMRKENVTGLRWRHIQLPERRIFIPAEEMKNGQDFETAIHPELATELRALLRGQATIDPEALVVGYTYHGMDGAWKSLVKRLKETTTRDERQGEIRFHDLRHTSSTWWAEKFPHAVHQALMGHAPRDMTDRYSHVRFETLKAAVDSMPRLLQTNPADARSPVFVGEGR